MQLRIKIYSAMVVPIIVTRLSLCFGSAVLLRLESV